MVGERVISRYWVSGPAAVGAGHGHVGVDDPHHQAVQARRVGPVGQVLQHAGITGGLGRASSTAPVAWTSAKNAFASNARSSSTASTASARPDDRARKMPLATVTAVVTVVMADWVFNRPLGNGTILTGCSRIYQRSRSLTRRHADLATSSTSQHHLQLRGIAAGVASGQS